MQPGGLRAGIGCEAGAEMGAGVEAGMGAGTNQTFTSRSLFQAQTSLSKARSIYPQGRGL